MDAVGSFETMEETARRSQTCLLLNMIYDTETPMQYNVCNMRHNIMIIWYDIITSTESTDVDIHT